MPTAGGPNTLGESSLVFAYDTSDVKNSYKGEPTVNLITNADTMASWTTYYRTVTLTSFITEFGTTGYRFASQPSWNGIYKNFNLGSAGFYTFSAWFKYSGGSVNNNGATVYISNYGGGDTAAALDKTKVGIWQRVSFTVNVTSPSNVYFFLISFGGTDNGTGNPDFSSWEVTMPQIEPLSHSTPFVNGTRSVTQGLLPLVGNSTINLSNVSFDSNAKIIFDGTDDYIAVRGGTGVNQFSGDFTISLWAMRTAGGAYGNLIGDYYTNSTVTTGEWQIMMGPSSELNFYKVGPGYIISSISSGFSNNTWINVVVTRSGNLVTMYANSNAIATGTDSTSYGTATGLLNIGIDGNGSSEPFPGKIDKVEMYNRSLTAQEVRQNYQQHKTRFNLS